MNAIGKKSLSTEQREIIAGLIARHKFTLYTVERGKVYLLLYHWRYRDPLSKAQRVLLFKCVLKDGMYYNTEI